MQLAPGDVFAGYRVVRQIGSGGMGAVYLVEHPRLPRRDALKLLNRELSAEPILHPMRYRMCVVHRRRARDLDVQVQLDGPLRSP